MKKDLSIVIPCYNESKNIPIILKEFKRLKNLKFKKINFEVIIVNNNSKDNTEKVLNKLIPKYSFLKSTFEKEPGYGSAILSGLKKSKGEILCWTHGDLQTPIKDIFKGYQLIKKSKNEKTSFIKGKRKNRRFGETFFTFFMSIFSTAVTFKYLHDINGQPTIFHKDFLDEIQESPKDYMLDFYFYLKAKKLNFEIIRYPVYFLKRKYGKSKWKINFLSKVKFIKRNIKYILKYNFFKKW